MRLQGKSALFIICAALFGAAFAVAFLWLGPKEQPGRSPGPSSKVAVAPGAEAVVHYLLVDGHIAATDVSKVPDALVGLTLQELQNARPEWSIVSFAPERVVASVPCGPVTGAAGFIGVKDGKVAIFRGRPGGCHELQEVTDIGAEHLGASANQSAESVIPFDDPSELPFILEGLKGHTL